KRVFELTPGGVEIAGGERDQSRPKACGGEQRRRLGFCSNVSKLLDRHARATEVVALPKPCFGADQHLEGGCAFGAVLCRHPAEMPLGELCGASWVALFQRQRGASKQRNRVRATAIEQGGRFIESSLTTTELPEPCKTVRRHAGPTDGEFVAGIRELAL